MNLRDQLIRFEGWKNKAYPDPLTGGEPWTIGVGHTGPEVHEGLVWTDAQIDAALDIDIANAMNECYASFDWIHTMNDPRQAVIIEMVFQMGLNRTLKFKKALAGARDEKYAVAAEEIRQSVWAKQTPKRAILLAAQLETGAWA